MNKFERLLLILFLTAVVRVPLSAQDVMPAIPAADVLAADVDTALLHFRMHDTLPLISVSIPKTFRNTHDSVLRDPEVVLSPFWDKLERVLSGVSQDTVRVLHVGDSHIRGHIYPNTVRDILTGILGPKINYTDMGINGATCASFSTPQNIRQMADFKPDLLIMSFGTNESHSRAYDTMRHYHQMQDFLSLVREALPDVPILLTTPPGSYERVGRGRRRTYSVNPRTAEAAQTIVRFASDKHLAVWDLYNTCGGASRACLNWFGAHLMQRDRIHYIPDGYALQGELLYQAIAKTFNHYVEPN